MVANCQYGVIVTNQPESYDVFREALVGPDAIRIEIAPTLNFSQGEMVDTARVFTRTENGRWRKVGPLLLPPKGGDRADLLALLARVIQD